MKETIVGADFVVFGVVVSSLGYFFVQSVPIAAFGIAFMTIGAVILLTVPDSESQYTYSSVVPDAIANVEIILQESSARERAYFLPMKSEKILQGNSDNSDEKEIEASEIRAFVPVVSARDNGDIIHTPADSISSTILGAIACETPRRFILDYDEVQGLLLIPPGSELPRRSNLKEGDDLEESLQKVLLDFSELAKSVICVSESPNGSKLESRGHEVENKLPSKSNQVVKLQISRPKVLSTSPYFSATLGSPVSCVSCCVIAAVTGKPVRILTERFDSAVLRLNVEIFSS